MNKKKSWILQNLIQYERSNTNNVLKYDKRYEELLELVRGWSVLKLDRILIAVVEKEQIQIWNLWL
jgi:hypothetical protein